MKTILVLVLVFCSSSVKADDGNLFIVEQRGQLPTIAMHEIPGSRPVKDSDLSSVTKAVIKWDRREAKELSRLRHFSRLSEIHIGRGTLQFPDLKHLAPLKLKALFVGDSCQAYPGYLKVLKEFPQLERLGIDFGFDGIAQTMKAIQLEELEVLRRMPNLKELRIDGNGVTSLASPRLSNHPNLEILLIGNASVGVKRRAILEGLPKLKSLRFPKIDDRNVVTIIGLESLESLSGDASELSIGGFELLLGLPKLKKLNLDGFWVPEDELTVLNNIRRYSADELKAIHLVNVLRQTAQRERDYEIARNNILTYGPMMSGTADERIRKPWKREIHKLVQQVVGENHSSVGTQRSLAQAALKYAASSSRKDFYRNVHRTVERTSGLKFSHVQKLRKSVDVNHSRQGKKTLISNSIGMKFRVVPAGSFEIEDKKTGEPVYAKVTRPFLLGVHEVTQGQFQQIMGKNPSVEKDRRYPQLTPLGDNLPVNKIRVYDALNFCSKLSNLEAEKKAGRSYRLPAEIEWELACRAGTTTQFSFGESGDFLPKHANLSLKKDFPFEFVGIRNVGSYPANGFGLYDMHGNVTELCIDRRGEFNPSSPDFVNLGAKLGNHVFRGGDYSTFANDAGSGYRSRHQEYFGDVAIPQLGFRVVCVTGQASPLSRKILEYQSRMISK